MMKDQFANYVVQKVGWLLKKFSSRKLKLMRRFSDD